VISKAHHGWTYRWCVPLLVLLACGRTGPNRATRTGARAGLGIPYPVGEPERIEGWSRAALSRSDFAVVFTVPDASGSDTRFDRRVAGAGPVMVGAHIREGDAQGAPFSDLLALAFRGRRPLQPSGAAVSAEALAGLGYHRPAPSLFLVGPDGTCRAEIGDPTVGYYEADGGVLQIDWSLRGCDVGTAWAPVGVVSNRLPADTVWVAATVSLDAQFDASAGWQGPLAAALTPPRWHAEYAAGIEVVRVLEIPGVQPTVVQVYDSLVRLANEETYGELSAQGLDRACADEHSTTTSHGQWNGEIFDPFELAASDQALHLLGAFVRGGQIDGLVYDQSLNPLVAIPPAPTMEGESPWVKKTLTAAVQPSSARDSWGYLPTSDPSPRGDPCVWPSG